MEEFRLSYNPAVLSLLSCLSPSCVTYYELASKNRRNNLVTYRYPFNGTCKKSHQMEHRHFLTVPAVSFFYILTVSSPPVKYWACQCPNVRCYPSITNMSHQVQLYPLPNVKPCLLSVLTGLCPLLSLYNQYITPGPAVSPSLCVAYPSHWPLSVAIPL